MTSITRGFGRGTGNGAVLVPQKARLHCALVDLEDCCGLRESLAGYEAALSLSRVSFAHIAPGILTHADAVMVPGCARLEPAVARALRSSLQRGSLVVIESGAAYAEPAEFEAHRRALDSHFELEVGAPVDLWPDGVMERSTLFQRGEMGRRQARRTRVPYVDFTWPIEAKVRDFSRVVPLRASFAGQARGFDPIGWVEGRPIAARHNVGKGTLVYLGSPLGQALRYGDREAERWLNALLRMSGRLYFFAGSTRPKRVKS